MNWSACLHCGAALSALLGLNQAALSQGLPPNWEAGGNSTLRMRPRTTMRTGSSSAAPGAEDPRESETAWTLGATISSPELLKIDLRYFLNRTLHFNLSVAPGWPYDVTVEMPSDVIKSDKTNTLAAAYTAFDANFKATWGPHVSLGSFWHPFGGSWFVSTGGGYRELSLKGSASSQLRVCTISEAQKEPPCGNDQASLQTRNHLEVSAKARVTSIMAQASTGWLWRPGEHWDVFAAVGATRAVSTKLKVNVTAEIVAPDGTPQELSGALHELKLKSEQDVAAKAETELGKFTDQTLPLAALGVAYRF